MEQNTASCDPSAEQQDQPPGHFDPHGGQGYEQNYAAAYDQGLPSIDENYNQYGSQEDSQRQQQQPVAVDTSSEAAQASEGGGPPPFMFNPTTYGGPSAFSRQQSSTGGRSRQASLSESAPSAGSLYSGQLPPSSLPVQPAPTQNGAAKSSSNNNNEKAATSDTKKQQTANSKNNKGNNINTKAKKSSSWLGGIFGKLVGNTNQVHLPDDSDKKIVYDEKLGRWVNMDGDEDEMAPAAPPPMDPAFAAAGPASMPTAAAVSPTATSPSGFRAQPGKRRGRGYVDVFGQAGATKPVPVSPMMLVDPMLPPGPPGGGGSSGPSAGLLPPAIFNPTLTAHSNDDIPSSVMMPGQDIPSAAAAEGPVANGSDGPSSLPMMFNPSYMTTVSAPPAF